MTDLPKTPLVSGSDEPGKYGTLRILIVLLSFVATLIAGYLLFTSVSKSGQPLGCGAESGCATVLTSRWSQVLGVPVSLPAVLTYLGIITATLALPKLTTTYRRNASQLLAVLGLILMLAAIWFVGLQVFFLKSICPWCMAEHGLGLTVGLMTLFLASRGASVKLSSSATAAVLLFGVFIAGQALGPYTAPSADRMTANKGDSDSGAGDTRQVALLDGKLLIRPAELPLGGAPDAENLIVVLLTLLGERHLCHPPQTLFGKGRPAIARPGRGHYANAFSAA